MIECKCEGRQCKCEGRLHTIEAEAPASKQRKQIMMMHSVLPVGFGVLAARQNSSFSIATQPVQDHLPPPPCSTLGSSSSENSNTERILQDLITDPSPFTQKKHLRDDDPHVSEHSLCINGCKDVDSINGSLEAMESVLEESMGINGSISLCDHVVPSVSKASNVQDSLDLDTKFHSRYTKRPGTIEKRSKKSHDSPLRAHLEAQTVEEALASLEKLTDEPLPTDIFICILKKCRKYKALVPAKRLHLHMCKHGIESHGVLENYLITVFVDCGCVDEAQQLVNRLAKVDEHSWNTLIQGYIDCGDFKQAFKLYKEMQEECVPSRRYILMALLKTFASLKCLEECRELHAKIVEKELERDRFFCNTLIDMYVKCDSLIDAQEVFDEHPSKDMVLWSTLVNGYTELGYFEDVLRCWDQMVSEGLDPDVPVFVCSLKACANVKNLNKGHEIHARIVERMLEQELIVGNSLVDMYAKCGSLADSQQAFDKLSVRDVVTWSSLIAGYADHNFGDEALKLFDQMQLSGVTPNDVTFLCILKACGALEAIEKGQEIHAQIVTEEYDNYPLVSSALVDMYSKFGLFSEAQLLFNRLPVRNVITWTALLEAYAEHGLYKRALGCFQQMQLQGILPNIVTFLCMLKVCWNPGSTKKGRELHLEIVKRGFEKDLLVSSSLVDMYGKCGSLAEAQHVFDRLANQNVVSWTALLVGYANRGHGKEALDCFKQMKEKRILPEAITYVYSLKACGDCGVLEKGQSMHEEVLYRGVEKRDRVSPALVYMYAKNGALVEAQALFDSLQSRDITSWHMLIGGFAEHGFCEKALHGLKQMQLEGVSPHVTTWVLCTKACQSPGLIDRCFELHSQIVKQGFEGGAFIGHRILDMYAFHGSFSDAKAVFDKLPDRNPSMWSAIIAGFC